MLSYLKRLGTWIEEGKYLFIFVAILILVFQLDKINIGFKTVDNIRFFGLILQLTGTLTIVYSLKDKLFIFKGHGLAEFFGDYFKRFPLKKIERDYRLEGNATAYATATANARVVRKPKEDMKDIIRYFEEEVQYLHQRLADTKTEVKKAIDDLNTKIATLKNDFNKEIKSTKDLIKDSAVSNIWLESFGLACVFIGLILGTVPDIVEKIV